MAANPTRPVSYAYDVEVFHNFFSVTFRHVNSLSKKVFMVFADPQNSKRDRNQLPALHDFITHDVRSLVGYNNHHYDDIMIKHLVLNYEMFKNESAAQICASCKGLNDKIIPQTKEDLHKRDPWLDNLKAHKLFPSLDLMQTFNTIDRVGLKQIAINIKWPLIVDLPFDPSYIVMEEDIDKILFYNSNDVDITKALLKNKKMHDELELRVDLTRELGVELYSASRTSIAKTVLRKYYAEATKQKYADFKNKRTFYKYNLELRKCISPKINFMTPAYMDILNTMRRSSINPNMRSKDGKKKQFEYIHSSKYITHKIGLGGIHSETRPELLEENEEFVYIDLDVSSYYPRIIMNDRIYPKHLGKEFVDVYAEKIVKGRLQAKAEGKEVRAEVLKISANSTFGLTKSPYSWLYDPHVTTAICICGELYLLMLMERIELLTECVIVYSNTDGLTVRVPKGHEQKLYDLCTQWMEYTGFELEFARYRKMILRDVSNFLMITDNAKKPIKTKGDFVIDKPLNAGFEYPVISKALYDFFVNGTNPEYYIKHEKDPYEFMRAQRTNMEKYTIYFYSKNDPENPIKQQKTNRWMVTQGNPAEGRLMKFSLKRQKFENLQKQRMVTLMNDLTKQSKDISTFKIDYDFYIQEVWKTIRLIKASTKKTHIHQIQPKLFA